MGTDYHRYHQSHQYTNHQHNYHHNIVLMNYCH